MRIDEERGGTRFFQAVLAARRVELDGHSLARVLGRRPLMTFQVSALIRLAGAAPVGEARAFPPKAAVRAGPRLGGAMIGGPPDRVTAVALRRSRRRPSPDPGGPARARAARRVAPVVRRDRWPRGRARGARLGLPAPAGAIAPCRTRRGIPGGRVADARSRGAARAARRQLHPDRGRGPACGALAPAQPRSATAAPARASRLRAGRAGALRPVERVLRAVARSVADLLVCGVRGAGSVARGGAAAQVPPAVRPPRARVPPPPARDRHRLGRNGPARGARARLPRHHHHDLQPRSTSSRRGASPRPVSPTAWRC